MLHCDGIAFDSSNQFDRATTVYSESFALRALALRKWERSYLPMFTPQIALDILLYAAAMEASGCLASAKDFHLALGHSKDRTREVSQCLLSSQWIRCTSDSRDARVRRVSLTDRGKDLLWGYQRECAVTIA